MHDPSCADWREHVRRCVDELRPDEGWRLRDFVADLEASWDDERLAADPEAPVHHHFYKWSDIKRRATGETQERPRCVACGKVA